MDGGTSMGWWHKNADLGKLDGLSLLPKTKEMLGQTFMIIDNDGNGVLDSEDFSNLPAAMDKWDDLKLELFSNESTVDPRKFVIGITNKAWKNPADQAKQLFQAAETGKSYRNLTSILNKALNDSIEKTLIDLLCDLLLYTPEAREKMQEAWAALDFDKDDKITVKDFETRPLVSHAELPPSARTPITRTPWARRLHDKQEPAIDFRTCSRSSRRAERPICRASSSLGLLLSE